MYCKGTLFSQEVVTSYGGGQYKQPIDLDTVYWLVADVKYGAVDLKLDNTGMIFTIIVWLSIFPIFYDPFDS